MEFSLPPLCTPFNKNLAHAWLQMRFRCKISKFDTENKQKQTENIIKLVPQLNNNNDNKLMNIEDYSLMFVHTLRHPNVNVNPIFHGSGALIQSSKLVKKQN